VAKLTNFGAFVELEPELEGLLHISELADHKIDKPQDIVKVDDEVEVKILKVDSDARKIGLSLRRVRWAEEEQAAEAAAPRPHVPAGPEKVLSDAEADQIRRLQLKFGEGESADTVSEPLIRGPEIVTPPTAADVEAGAEPAPADAGADADADANADADAEAETPAPEASAEAPQVPEEVPQASDEAPQEQPEKSPDNVEQAGDEPGQEQEKN